MNYYFHDQEFSSMHKIICEPWAHLQRDVLGFRGYALHRFVVAATSTAVEDHAGRDVGVFRVLRILVEDVHQHFPWLALTLLNDVQEWED